MARRKAPDYPPELREPLPWPQGRLPVSAAEKASMDSVLLNRLAALLDHYGIEGGLEEPGNGWKLAMALASDHVPGFQSRAKPGAKPKSGADDALLVVAIIQGVRAGKSINETCQHLSKRPPFKGKSAETLRDRYYMLRSDGPERQRLVDLVSHCVENL